MQHSICQIGINLTYTGGSNETLPDRANRPGKKQEIMADLSDQLSGVPGLQINARSTNSLNIRRAGRGLQFTITISEVATMTDATDALVAAVTSDGAFINPQLSNDSFQAQ